jgi:hypothetical protein
MLHALECSYSKLTLFYLRRESCISNDRERCYHWPVGNKRSVLTASNKFGDKYKIEVDLTLQENDEMYTISFNYL